MTLPLSMPATLFPVEHHFLDLDVRWAERMECSIAFEEQ